MMLQLVTPAAVQPITRAEAKAHLRVDHSDEDTLIDSLIEAATAYVERFLGRALVEQTWDLYLDEFPATGPIEIPLAPVTSVAGVFYGGDNSPEGEMDAAGYVVDLVSIPGRIGLVTGGAWPTIDEGPNAVRVRFTAGYLDGDDSPPAVNVPAIFKSAIKLTLAALYDNRSSGALPETVELLLRPYRIHRGMA